MQKNKMKIQLADRLNNFQVYIFDKLDNHKAELEAEGMEVIDLGIGDPDMDTPEPIVNKLIESSKIGANHHYPSYKGTPQYRKSIANWYKRTFNVDLDPDNEVMLTIGSKLGMGMLPLTLVNPGEIILVPNPGYPAYMPGAYLSGADIHEMPLLEKNKYLPKLDEIPTDVAKKAKLMILNYPNNPTTALAPVSFWKELVEYARTNEIIVAHDIPYSEITYDGYHQESILEVEGSRDCCVEFHSFSKSYNMTGWRIGFVVGNSEVVQGLGKVRSNVDMGVFHPIQYAAVAAFDDLPDFPKEVSKIFQKRRDVLVEGFRSLGWKVDPPKATFFMWIKIPEDTPSMEFAENVLQETGVLVTPGVGFGSCGEGYIRVALTVSESVLEEAIDRLRNGGYVYNKNNI